MGDESLCRMGCKFDLDEHVRDGFTTPILWSLLTKVSPRSCDSSWSVVMVSTQVGTTYARCSSLAAGVLDWEGMSGCNHRLLPLVVESFRIRRTRALSLGVRSSDSQHRARMIEGGRSTLV